MHAMRAREAARRPNDNRRALVIRLVGLRTIADVALARLPGALEVGAIAVRIVVIEELLVARDARRDEILCDLVEDWSAFFIVRPKQCIATPALQPCGELPDEIDGVFEAAVETKSATGRVAVRGIARNKDPAGLITFRDCDAQVPGAEVIESAREGESGGLVQQGSGLGSGNRPVVRAWRQRRMEEPAFLRVDAAEELPVTLQVGVHHPVGRARRKSPKAFTEFARAKHREYHAPLWYCGRRSLSWK